MEGKDSKHFCPDPLKAEFKLRTVPFLYLTQHTLSLGQGFRACLYYLQSSCLGLANAGITGTRDHTKLNAQALLIGCNLHLYRCSENARDEAFIRINATD